MTTTTRKTAFIAGIRDGFPFIFLMAPFGMLFGVVAVEAGLKVIEALAFSVIVIAGAAQFTAVALAEDDVPTVVILLTALAVNLRMAMYSVALTPHLGGAGQWTRALMAYLMVDQSFALSSLKFEQETSWGLQQKMGYYFGVILPVAPTWYLATLAGALVGAQIPEALALDFALPLVFLAMVATALRTLAHIAAAAVSIILSLAFAFLPFSLGLLVAALVAMIVGARVEQWQHRRQGAAE